MVPQTPCPTAHVLQQLLLGLSEEQVTTELESHVAACPVCASRAGAIPAEDEVVRSVRRAGTPDTTLVPAATDPLKAVFRRMRGSVQTPTATWSGKAVAPVVPSADADTAGFLSAAQRPDEIGRIGPYAIHELLGAGGMGMVYRGFDPQLRREIAVKVIRRELLSDPGVTERFLAESRAAAAVEHDNIVGVYAVEVHDEQPCITMPLLKGETLEQRMRGAGGPLAERDVSRVAHEVANGLAAAHARGLVHRDIKPANVWLEAPDGRVKLLDFGLALVAGADDAGFAGTPGYMAPEQIRGEGIDARADLFSLGCVLYRAATGIAPFGSDNSTAVLVRTVMREPAPTALENPKVSPRLAGLIDRLLAKEADRRPESAAAVVAELAAIEAEAEARGRRITRRRWLFGVAAASFAGGLGVWFGRPARVEAPPPEPPVRIAFETDPDIGRVIFTREETEQEFDLSSGSDNALSLSPGDYTLRPSVNVPNRRLEPGAITVLPNVPKLVKLALVGEVDRATLHSQAVTGVAVVPNKDRFAVLSASRDRTLNEWIPGSKDQPRFVRLNSPALSFAATPDGTVVATAGGNKVRQPDFDFGVRLWDGQALKARGEPLAGHTRLVAPVALSADGKHLLSATTDEVFIWDVAKREHRKFVVDEKDAKVTAAALDDAGKRAITGHADGRVILWDVTAAEPKAVKRLTAQAAGEVVAIRAVVFTDTGFVSAGDDGVIRVWDGTTFKAREFPTKGKPVLSLALSKDGKRLLTGGEDESVKLWSVADGTLVFTFTGHKDAVNAVVFTPDGRGAVSGGNDLTVRLWRLPFE